LNLQASLGKNIIQVTKFLASFYVSGVAQWHS